jgi:hypothetical protein
MSTLAESLEPPVPQDEIDAAAVETPEEKPAEAQAPEGETPKDEQQKPPDKMVPHAALHEERQRRKELQAQVAREQQERAQQMALLNQRIEQMWAAQNPGPQLRDPNTDPDPVGALAHNQNLSLQALQQIYNEKQTNAAQQRQVQQVQQLVGWAAQAAADYSKEVPDFGDAYQHVIKMRVGELEAMGMPPQQIKQTLENDELWIYSSAAQNGRNPAEIVYNMAKNTGYTAKKADAVPAEQKMESLQNGVKASKSLGGSGAVAGKPTAEQLAAMDDDEFAEFKKTLAKKGQRLSDVM